MTSQEVAQIQAFSRVLRDRFPSHAIALIISSGDDDPDQSICVGSNITDPDDLSEFLRAAANQVDEHAGTEVVTQ